MARITRDQLITTLVVLFVLALLAAIIIPNFVRARENGGAMFPGKVRVIESAKEQWALENKKLPTDPVSLSDLTGYFKNNTPPKPEEGESYILTTVSEPVKVILPDDRVFTTTSF